MANARYVYLISRIRLQAQAGEADERAVAEIDSWLAPEFRRLPKAGSASDSSGAADISGCLAAGQRMAGGTMDGPLCISDSAGAGG